MIDMLMKQLGIDPEQMKLQAAQFAQAFANLNNTVMAMALDIKELRAENASLRALLTPVNIEAKQIENLLEGNGHAE